MPAVGSDVLELVGVAWAVGAVVAVGSPECVFVAEGVCDVKAEGLGVLAGDESPTGAGEEESVVCEGVTLASGSLPPSGGAGVMSADASCARLSG